MIRIKFFSFSQPKISRINLWHHPEKCNCIIIIIGSQIPRENLHRVLLFITFSRRKRRERFSGAHSQDPLYSRRLETFFPPIFFLQPGTQSGSNFVQISHSKIAGTFAIYFFSLRLSPCMAVNNASIFLIPLVKVYGIGYVIDNLQILRFFFFCPVRVRGQIEPGSPDVEGKKKSNSVQCAAPREKVINLSAGLLITVHSSVLELLSSRGGLRVSAWWHKMLIFLRLCCNYG